MKKYAYLYYIYIYINFILWIKLYFEVLFFSFKINFKLL